MDKQTIEVLKAAVQAIEEGDNDYKFVFEEFVDTTKRWEKSFGEVMALDLAASGIKLRLPCKTTTITLPECVQPSLDLRPIVLTTTFKSGFSATERLYFADEADHAEAFNTLKALAK